MRERGAGAVLLVWALVTGCTAAPAPAGTPLVWVRDSLARVGRADPPATGTAVRLTAARGETESFQVVVTGSGGAVSGVDLEVSALSGAGGTLPLDSVTRYREQYVTVSGGSPSAGGSNRPLGPGVYADGLVPFTDPDSGQELDGPIAAKGATIGAGQNQPYWVDVAVPAAAKPGRYTGTYRVRTGQGEVLGHVELTVLGLTLPAAPALHTAFGTESERPSVLRELLRHSLMPADPVAELGGLVADPRLTAANAGFFSGADRSSCAMDPPPAVADIAAAMRAVPAGTLFYNYTADEIDECDTDFTTALQAWARALHAGGARQLVTMPPDPALFADGAGKAGVDIWAVLPSTYDAAVAEQARAAGLGMQLWSYTSLAQDTYSPKWLVDFSPMDFRVLPGFLNQSLGLTGTLYWRVDGWGADPWRQVVLYDGRFPGDGMLVYPGEDVGLPGGAAPSLRLKWLRDAVEDYGFATLARAVAPADRVDGVVRRVAEGWRDWTRDPAVLLAARAELATLAGG